MMQRTRDYYRYHRRRIIRRKKQIISDQNNYWSYKHEGELSKGKIFCSCPLCRRKSYDFPKFCDRKKKASMIDEALYYLSSSTPGVSNLRYS